MWQQVNEDFWKENRESKVGQVQDTVREIVESVREHGDATLRELAKKFDRVDLKEIAVSRDEIEEAYEKVKPGVVEELENAAYNIERFHRMQKPSGMWLSEVEPGITLGVKTTPLERVGCYIPGGRASYPSTVLMTAIPAKVAGVDEVIIVNSREKPQIESYFRVDGGFEDMLRKRGKKVEADLVHEASSMPVSFVYQDNPRGLGHAVHCAAEAVGDEPVFVLLGDYFVPDRQMCVRMAEVSRQHGNASVIAVAPVPADQVSRYGIIAGECVGSLDGSDTADEQEGAVWKVTGLVEKPAPEDAPSHLFIVGRYLLSPRIMDLLANQGVGAGGEIQLTDAMERLLAEEDMYALVVDVDEGCDTGTPAAWAGVNARLALKDPSTREAFLEALGRSGLSQAE